MATTQLLTNNYRLRNAIAFVNSFSSAYQVNTVSASFTGTLTSPSNSWITSISSTTGIGVGQLLTSSLTSGIPTGTTVLSVNATVVVMSQPAGASGTTTVNTYTSAASSYYMFAGQSGNWTSGVVPQYYDTPKTTQFVSYNNMLFGKSITPSDVSLMIPAYPWISGYYYSMYDDIDPLLSTKNFFVYVFDGSYYYVFKCLYNNNGAASIYQPNFADAPTYLTNSSTYYQTADGYQWKYMYKFPAATYNKFATTGFIPVVPDANVTSTAIPGAVDVIVPVDANGNITQYTGSGYNNYYSSTFYSGAVINTTTPLATLNSDASKSNNFYNGCYLYITSGTGAGTYKQVTGHVSNSSGIFVTLDSQFPATPDNTTSFLIAPAVVILNSSDQVVNVAAIALVSNTTGNSIYQVQVLNRGANVFAAAAYINASPQVGITNTATIRVIAGPKGGHGSNVAAELYASAVGISTTFSNTESNTIPTVNDYQTVGIIANPLFANVIFSTNNSVGTFISGETVTQTLANVISTAVVTVTSPLQVTNASGTFATSTNVSSGLIVGSISGATAQITGIQISGQAKGFRTFSQLYAYNGYYNGTPFTTNEIVYQANIAVSNAIFYANNTTGTIAYVSQKLGPIYTGNTLTNNSGYTFTINTKTMPDLVPESGDLIFIENFSAVNRSNTQSETIKLIMQF